MPETNKPSINMWLEWHCWENCLWEFNIQLLLGWFHSQNYVHLSQIHFGCGCKSFLGSEIIWLSEVAWPATSCLLNWRVNDMWVSLLTKSEFQSRLIRTELAWKTKQIGMVGNALTISAPFSLSLIR